MWTWRTYWSIQWQWNWIIWWSFSTYFMYSLVMKIGGNGLFTFPVYPTFTRFSRINNVMRGICRGLCTFPHEKNSSFRKCDTLRHIVTFDNFFRLVVATPSDIMWHFNQLFFAAPALLALPIDIMIQQKI